jgi:uroporphyrinogen decarboxylase
MAYGTAEDVRKEVIAALEVMKPSYGYMLAPTHQIQDNSPVENVVKMYESALKYGKY